MFNYFQTKTLMGQIMKDAAFSLAEAKFASGGDFNQSVLQNVTKARLKIRSRMDNVAGLFDISSAKNRNYSLIILSILLK